MSRLEQILPKYNSLYVIDLSWSLYRSYYAFRNFSVNVDGYEVKTGHIWGLFSNVKTILKDDSDACIIICQDGIPYNRDKLMEESGLEYKEGRPDREYDFYKDTNKIKAILCSIPNVYWAYNEDKESDDEMYALAKQAELVEGFTGNIYIYSGDNDLLQSIDDRISVVRSHNKGAFNIIDEEVVMTDEQFTKKFHGVGPRYLVNFRAIVGDPSDKISGIPRFPRDIAVKIATIQNWEPQTDKEIKWHKIYQDNKDLIERNHKLMKLSSDYEVNITKPVVNRDKLLALLDWLKFSKCKEWMKEEGIL